MCNIFDGFTGIITHPYRDMKKEGVKGLGKGVGRGVGGLVFKTIAAIIGVPAYTLKGIEKQVEKLADRDRDQDLKSEILAARMQQALEAFRQASEEEKKEIVKRWKHLGIA